MSKLPPLWPVRRLAAHVISMLAIAASAGASGADVITYLSASRSVSTFHQYPAPQPNFVSIGTNGLQDFNEHQLVYPEYRFDGLLLNGARLRADQTSRLLPDRIEASCFAETAVTTVSGLLAVNSLSASSVCQVTFSLSQPTYFALYTGPVFYQIPSINGGAAVGLLVSGTNQAIFYTEVQRSPIVGLLQPGTYDFFSSALAASGRTGGFSTEIGPAQAVATLVLPSPSVLASWTLALGSCGARNWRRRQGA